MIAVIGAALVFTALLAYLSIAVSRCWKVEKLWAQGLRNCFFYSSDSRTQDNILITVPVHKVSRYSLIFSGIPMYSTHSNRGKCNFSQVYAYRTPSSWLFSKRPGRRTKHQNRKHSKSKSHQKAQASLLRSAFGPWSSKSFFLVLGLENTKKRRRRVKSIKKSVWSLVFQVFELKREKEM